MLEQLQNFIERKLGINKTGIVYAVNKEGFITYENGKKLRHPKPAYPPTQINLIHRNMTDKEILANLAKLHKQNPELYLSPKEWKKLNKEYGKNTNN